MKNVCLIFLLCFSATSMAQMPQYNVKNCTELSRGYYFLSNTENLIILDRIGNPVYYKPGKNLSNFALQQNGWMSYAEFTTFKLMDSSFRVVDTVRCKNVPLTNYRDLQLLPNGHFLLIGTDSMLLDLGNNPFWKNKMKGDSISVKYTVVQEQNPNHQVVFEWRAKDYYEFNDADTFYLTTHLNSLEWTHSNAVETDRDGNILLSNRNFNEITKINRKDGSLMWRLGGKRNQFKFINCSLPFYGQHDIRRLDNGRITLFDNGDHTTPHGARALEFELDENKRTAKLKWSYTLDSSLYSTRQGNVQRLANSNTLINYGNTAGNSNSQISFLVVDKKGNNIFQIDGLHSYRVFNYPTLPWQLPRPQIACKDSIGITYLGTEETYSSYKWNTGDSSRFIAIVKPDVYSVFVPYGEGGYISSENVNVKELSKGCVSLMTIDKVHK